LKLEPQLELNHLFVPEEETKIEEQVPSEEPAGGEETPKEPQDSVTPEEQIAKLQAQQQANYERFKKEKTKAEELEAKLKTAEEAVQKINPKVKEEVNPVDSIIEVQRVTKDLTADEIEEMKSQANHLETDTIKFIGSDAGKSYLEAFRKKKESEQSIPSPSQKSEEEKKEKKTEEMTPDERADKFEELIIKKKKASGI